MNDETVELNAKIKKMIKEYNYSDFQLSGVFGYDAYKTVSQAIKEEVKNAYKISKGKYKDDYNYIQLVDNLSKIKELNYLNTDPLINVDDVYNPKPLTVDQLNKIINDLESVRAFDTLIKNTL